MFFKVNEILKSSGVAVNTVKLYWENGNVAAYLIDGKYILKVSASALDEQTKHNRVKSLRLVPKIHLSGSFAVSDCEYYYVMTDYIQGVELWSAAQNLTDKEQYNIGKEIAQFLNELHSITGDSYDIGHYIPTIPGCSKSWKEGHIDYTAVLKDGISRMDIEADNEKLISEAFDYIYTNIDSLKYQEGAKLLHNDFHPKNIIVHEGRLSGVIDWECSQFGEADFDLTHLFCWCIYPENYLLQENNLEILIKSVIEHLRILSVIPDMEKRMTIYQLEHELNQLLWNGKKQEEERINRIHEWLSGKAYAFLKIYG